MYISSEQLDEVLRVFQKNNLPLRHTIPFLCKLKGLSIQKIALTANKDRGYFYEVLKGKFRPSEEFRNHVRSSLGVDPWLYDAASDPAESNNLNTKSVSRDTE